MISIYTNEVVYKTSKIDFLKDYIMFGDQETKTVIPICQIGFIDFYIQDTIVEFSEDGNIKVIKEEKGE